jgi:hypothetical protein
MEKKYAMSKVNRSIYQKEVEKNRKLMRDLRSIVMDCDFDTHMKWYEHFTRQRQEEMELTEMIKDWMKANPNDAAVIAVNKLTEDYEKHRKGPGQA